MLQKNEISEWTQIESQILFGKAHADFIKSNGNRSYKLLQDGKGKILARIQNDVNVKKFYTWRNRVFFNDTIYGDCLQNQTQIFKYFLHSQQNDLRVLYILRIDQDAILTVLQKQKR